MMLIILKMLIGFISVSVCGLFFLGKNFKLLISISWLVIELFRFSISSWLHESVSVVFPFLEFSPFHLGYLICWYTIIHSIILFYFCKIGSNIPYFIPDFSNLRLLFYLWPKGVSVLLIFSKNQLFGNLLFFFSGVLSLFHLFPL